MGKVEVEALKGIRQTLQIGFILMGIGFICLALVISVN